MGPIEAAKEDKAKETSAYIDEMLKSALTDPPPYNAKWWTNPPLAPRTLQDETEDAFNFAITDLLKRIVGAPEGKLEPLTTALNAVVQAHDTYTYEEDTDND